MELRQRFNLVNRRLVAALVDWTLASCVIVPLVEVLYVRGEHPGRDPSPSLAPLTSIAVFVVIRDLVGTSAGKRLVGLEVVRAETREPIAWYQAIHRNWAFALGPIIWLLEYIMALRDPDCRRGGDRVARTRVLDVGSDVMRTGGWWGFVLTGILVAETVSFYVVPFVTRTLLRWL